MKAKTLIYIFLCMSSIMHTQESDDTVPTRAPQLQQPGILGTKYGTAIKPADVKYGAYDITEPGYYYLTGNIVFNPDNFCPADGDQPCATAVIHIISDNVVLDLNTHSIGQDPTSNFPDFPLIKLGGRSSDPSDTTVYAPKNVTIKNGSLVHSTGYGIYGQDNAQIAIYDITFIDHANAAIQLENLQDSRIEHITIHGSPSSTGNAYGIYLRDNSTSVPFWTSPGDGTSGPQSITLKNINISGIFTASTLDPLASLLQKLECAALALNTNNLFTAANATGVTAAIKTEALTVVDTINTLKALILSVSRGYPQDEDGNAITQATLITSLEAITVATQNAIDDLQDLQASVNAIINPTLQDVQVSLEAGYLIPLLEDVVAAANMVILMCGDPAPYDYVDGIIYGANENGLAQILGAMNAIDTAALSNLLNTLENVTTSIENGAGVLVTRVAVLKTLITTSTNLYPYRDFITNIINFSEAFLEAIDDVSLGVSNLGVDATEDDYTIAVAAESLTADANTLVSTAQEYLYQWRAEWHPYALRITQGKGIMCENIHIVGVQAENDSLDGLVAVGIALEGCENIKITESSVAKVQVTSNAYSTAIGYGLFGTGLGDGEIAEPGEPDKLCTGNVYTHDTTTNNTDTQYVFGWFGNSAHSNVWTACKASSQQGTLQTKGFYIAHSNSNLFEHCESYDHSCIPSEGTDALAIGFDSVNGYSNIFKYCESYNMQADTTFVNESYNAQMLSIGFRLGYVLDSNLAERGSVIDHCIARCNRGGRGQAVGILLDWAAYCTITNNQVSGNEAMNAGNTTNIGNGYGIWDVSDDTSSLIIQNFSYVNQNGNYKVTYSGANEQLPVVSSTYGDMTALFSASSWNNISLNPNPGASGCVGACDPFDEITE